MFVTSDLTIKKSYFENMDDLTKIFLHLSNTGEKLGDENQVIILLNSLLESYKEVKTAIKINKDY